MTKLGFPLVGAHPYLTSTVQYIFFLVLNLRLGAELQLQISKVFKDNLRIIIGLNTVKVNDLRHQ